MNKRYYISVIFPVYNEEENIEKTIRDSLIFLKKQNIFEAYEIIVIDDGSKDRTPEILKDLKNKIPCLKVVTHNKNLGYGAAIVSGFKEGRFSLVFFMDADGQFEVSSLKEAMGYVLDYDVVTGCRLKREDSLYRVALGKAYALLMRFLFRLEFKDINCGFKLFKRKVIEDSYEINRGLFCAEFLLRAKNRGFRIKEAPVKHFSRIKGKQTGASLKVIANAVVEIFKLGILQAKK